MSDDRITDDQYDRSTDFLVAAFGGIGVSTRLAEQLRARAAELCDRDALKQAFLHALCLKRLEVGAARVLGVDQTEVRRLLFGTLDEMFRRSADT